MSNRPGTIHQPYLDVLIVGYTGAVGSLLLTAMIKSDRIKSIICLGRNKPPVEHHKLHFVSSNFDKMIDHQHLLSGVQRVYCCLGTTIKKAGSQKAFRTVDYDYVVNLAQLAQQAGVPHFSVISAIGANKNSNIFYSRVKGEMEHALIQTNFQRLSIYQPGLLQGHRNEFRLGEKAANLVISAFKYLIPSPYRGISCEIVAKAMLLNSFKSDEEVEWLQNKDMEALAKGL